MTIKFCKYYDCGWCYAPDEVKTNDVCGGCNNPQECPSNKEDKEDDSNEERTT